MKTIFKLTVSLLLILILVIGGYAAYVFIDYYRIEDNLILSPEGMSKAEVPIGETLEMTSWNIGFGAYTAEYSFFMDGGEYSRGFSEEAVYENVVNMADELKKMDSQFYLIQEVDIDSTRSYHIDQKELLLEELSGKSSTFALNYDSPYLFYPITEPHGKSLAGLLTLSDYTIQSSLRRSLPIQENLAKLVDCDRCYTVNRIEAENGKELIIYNFHLSAYTTDPTIANRQLEMLYEDITAEYNAGNYVICGGDFNKDLLGDSSQYFGVSGEDYSWAQSFPFDTLPEGFQLVAPLDPENPVPSCRNADSPWNPETNFQITIDGFIISDNITLVESNVVNMDFAYSDHNPVKMDFYLEP